MPPAEGHSPLGERGVPKRPDQLLLRIQAEAGANLRTFQKIRLQTQGCIGTAHLPGREQDFRAVQYQAVYDVQGWRNGQAVQPDRYPRLFSQSYRRDCAFGLPPCPFEATERELDALQCQHRRPRPQKQEADTEQSTSATASGRLTQPETRL